MTATSAAGSSSLALSVTVAVAVAAAAFCWRFSAPCFDHPCFDCCQRAHLEPILVVPPATSPCLSTALRPLESGWTKHARPGPSHPSFPVPFLLRYSYEYWTVSDEAQPSSESKQGATGAKPGDKAQQKQVQKQGAPSALTAIYDAVQGALSKKGLNVDAVQGSRQYFLGLGGGSGAPNGTTQQPAFWGSPQPIKYVDLPEPAGPLAFPTVRLLVIPLEDGPALQSQAAAATREVVSKLPPGDMFFNSRSHYHITMFHTSGLFEPVTDPMAPGGGFPSGARPCDRPRTPDGLLTRELELLQGLVGSTTPPVLEVDRIVFADSGVLLMLMVEVDGDSVGSIRSRGRELFPGMPEKQPNIIHVSLMRYLNPAALDAATTKAVIAACERWTERLRGKRFTPQNMWFVYEEEYSTIVGKRNILPMLDSYATL